MEKDESFLPGFYLLALFTVGAGVDGVSSEKNGITIRLMIKNRIQIIPRLKTQGVIIRQTLSGKDDCIPTLPLSSHFYAYDATAVS